jgi:cytochrome P450
VQERLVPVLEEAYKKDSIIDLQDVFLRFAFDSSTYMVFGKHDGVPATSFIKAFDEASEAWAYNLVVPPAVCKLMKCLNMMNSTETKELKNIVHEYVSQMVESRKSELAHNSAAETEVGTDILSRFIKLQAEKGCSPLDKSLGSLFLSIIFASRLYLGALCWFFWLLSKHPEVEDNILMELSEVMDADQCSGSHSIYPDKWNFNMDELKDMKYLEAVLWESLRLYPPVPISYRRAVEDVVLPDGISVKEGSVVLCLIYGANRMDSVWGEDAMEFKPERWIGHEKKICDKYGYPVLGTDITHMDFISSMKCVAANVLVRYHVSVDPELCVEPKLALTLLIKDGLPVTLQSREDALLGH